MCISTQQMALQYMIWQATSAKRKLPISHLDKSYFRIKDTRARTNIEADLVFVQQGEPLTL